MSAKFYLSENFVDLDRAGIVESSHYGHLLLLGKDGEVIAKRGDASAVVYPRSSIKGVQAAAMVRAGLKLEPRLLALVCASHAGTPMHVAAIGEILKQYKLDFSNLKCTPRTPRGSKANRAYGEQTPKTEIADCSGKHAGMLATCVINGWDLDSYLDPNHPMQKAIQKELEDLIGAPASNVTVDGCGAPLFAATMSEFANGFHKMFTSDDPVLKEVFEACTTHPEMVFGEGEAVTVLMQRFPGLFIKDGAEGFLVAGYQSGETLIVKASDGSLRWQNTVIYRALELWGKPADPIKDQAVLYSYGGGVELGSMKATF